MKFENFSHKDAIKEGANKLERLNQEIENPNLSIEEKELKLEEATQIEAKLDYFEQELGVDPNEVLKIYENITPGDAEKEIDELGLGAVGSIGDNSEALMERLGGMAKNKCARVVAAILAAGVIGIGSYATEFSVTDNKSSAIERVDNKFNKKQKRNLKLFKGWAQEYGAEHLFTDEEFANMEVVGHRYDKAHEFFRSKIRSRRLQEEVPKKAKQQGTYKEYTDNNNSHKEFSAEGVSSPSLKTVESKKKQFLVTDYFTADGEEQFRMVMEDKWGEDGEKAYKYNIESTVKPKFKAYRYGKITKTEFLGWVKGYNDALKEMGATSDVIDIQKIPEQTIISGPTSDLDAI